MNYMYIIIMINNHESVNRCQLFILIFLNCRWASRSRNELFRVRLLKFSPSSSTWWRTVGSSAPTSQSGTTPKLCLRPSFRATRPPASGACFPKRRMRSSFFSSFFRDLCAPVVVTVCMRTPRWLSSSTTTPTTSLPHSVSRKTPLSASPACLCQTWRNLSHHQTSAMAPAGWRLLQMVIPNPQDRKSVV